MLKHWGGFWVGERCTQPMTPFLVCFIQFYLLRNPVTAWDRADIEKAKSVGGTSESMS